MTTSDIRTITREEIPLCVKVIRESFLTVARDLDLKKETSPRFTGFSISEERLYYQFDIEKRPMLCFCDGDKIVGYYSLSPVKDGQVELNNLAVLPEYRHRGIGEALMHDGVKRARSAGCKSVYVSIVDTNKRLRAWYESLGFKYMGARKLDGFDFLCGDMIFEI